MLKKFGFFFYSRIKELYKNSFIGQKVQKKLVLKKNANHILRPGLTLLWTTFTLVLEKDLFAHYKI